LPSQLLAAQTGDISVIHAAAAVSFTQPLVDAAASNITAALKMQELAKGLGGKYVHFSTAFVHGNNLTEADAPLQETLFNIDLAKHDPQKLYESMVNGSGLAPEAQRAYGFPNTYVST
jgi:hypothetical protein